MGVIAVVVVIVASVVTGAGSTAGVASERELVRRAVRVGDYETARRVWKKETTKNSAVLGVETELEELIYPERKIEEEIKKYEQLLTTYPNNRDILLHLSRLCRIIESGACASEYWEQARILDPNNAMFRQE